MEIFVESYYLNADIKQRVVEELGLLNFVIDCDIPISRGTFGHVYKTRSVVGEHFGACKVIVIPDGLSQIEKEDLMKFVQQEVNIS